MSAKSGFSASDLQLGAKGLNNVDVKSTSSSSNDGAFAAIESLEKVYNKYNGDIDAIFEELNANPSKAKKPHHKPKDAKEFATKYLQGYYTVIDAEAESKDSRK